MNTTGLAKYSSALIALAICSACAGSAVAPSAAGGLNVTYVGGTLVVNGRPVTAARLSPMPRYATILPDRHTKSRTFEYVSNYNYGGSGGPDTEIFDYPKSTEPIGTIATISGAECANALYGYGKKYFWIVSSAAQITEFEVLKKPIKTLSVAFSFPSSCAVNANGDLAVGVLAGSGGGDVVIFKNASGSGTVYTTPLAKVYFDGYDRKGNLFADGFTGSDKFGLVELPKGSGTFETITTSNTVQFPGSVQWDGRYVTVFDQFANATYRYAVHGAKAALQGTVSLSGSSDCAQTWLAAGIVYCADAGNNDVEIFKYPTGGTAIGALTDGVNFPLGVTAAEK